MFAPLLIIAATLAPPSFASIAGLDCHAVASKENSLPEICIPPSYRDELAVYMNLSEIYLLEVGRPESRFADRVELIADLSENKVTVGEGRITLRINSFLRVKDAKDFLGEVRSRFTLIKASAETDRLMKQLAMKHEEAKLNLAAPLKSFLDAPFVGEGGQVIVADETPIAELKTKTASAIDPQVLEAVSAVSDKDCSRIRGEMIKSKEALKAELSDLKAAKELVTKALFTTPSTGHPKIKAKPTEMAESVAKSDCDLCFDAVFHCKAHGTLIGAVPPESNCRTIAKAKTCLKSLPASYRVPVDVCLGTPLKSVENVLDRRQADAAARISRIEATLARPGVDGCVAPTL